jgi:putative ABC transport system permease protein
MMLRPLPYPQSDRLVTIWEAYGPQDAINTVAPGNYHDWVREARSFDAIAAYSYFRTPANLTGAGDPEQLQIRYVTGGYFRVFGLTPLVGRGLDERDVAPDSRTIVISEGLWRRRFAGDPSIVGRDVRLSDRAQVVVGVMPAAFEAAAGRVDAWGGVSRRSKRRAAARTTSARLAASSLALRWARPSPR